jgi:hypothetical protein
MTGAPDQIDISEQILRLQRMLDESEKFRAETRKLIAESDKFAAEQRKLISEAQKFDRDRWLAPVLALVTVIGAVVSGVAIIHNILR